MGILYYSAMYAGMCISLLHAAPTTHVILTVQGMHNPGAAFPYERALRKMPFSEKVHVCLEHGTISVSLAQLDLDFLSQTATDQLLTLTNVKLSTDGIIIEKNGQYYFQSPHKKAPILLDKLGEKHIRSLAKWVRRGTPIHFEGIIDVDLQSHGGTAHAFTIYPPKDIASKIEKSLSSPMPT